MPPCAPPPFRSLTGGAELNLFSLFDHDRGPFVVRAKLAVHHTIVVDLTSGCDTAADFVLSGPVRLTATLPAPLPNSGLNAVRLIGTRPGTATVRITGRRTCSHKGVTTGMCFGRTGPVGTVTLNVTAT